MPRYANIDELLTDYLPEAKSDKEKAAVGRILDAASAFVDAYCKRPEGYFAGVAIAPIGEGLPPTYPVPYIKRVRGEGRHFLRLPVHVFGRVISVASGSCVIDSGLYYESEKNGWLYFENDGFGLEDTFSQSCSNRWIEGAIYKVTAVWGYAETPLPVVEAVRLITARIYSVQKGTIGQTTSEGFIQERLIPQAAKDLLKPFIKRESEI